MSENMLADLHDHVTNRRYGKYRGTVIDTDASTMRLLVSVPNVLDATSTGWASPCVPYAGPNAGFFMLPDVGAGVWVEFEGGDVSFPIWTGCYWNAGEIPGAVIATTKSIITSTGTLAFDTQANSVTLQDAAQHSIVLDSSGITETAGSGSVAIGAAGVSVNNGALQVS